MPFLLGMGDLCPSMLMANGVEFFWTSLLFIVRFYSLWPHQCFNRFKQIIVMLKTTAASVLQVITYMKTKWHFQNMPCRLQLQDTFASHKKQTKAKEAETMKTMKQKNYTRKIAVWIENQLLKLV